jgi:hypothetical protein
MAINETQSLIVQKHLKDDHPLLKKYSSGGIGTSFSDPLVFSGTYELVGLFNIEDNPYLPHFEFNVGSAYGIVVRRDSLAEGTMHQNRDGTRVQLR